MKNNNNSTTISVVIPTHNRPQDIKKALSSVFNQTLLPMEVVVVDDGSAPPVTSEVFADAHAGLNTVLLRNESPKGAPHARNLGINAAKGEWIAFLDDDDEFTPAKLASVSEMVKRNPNLDLIYHTAEINMVKEGVSYISGVGDVSDDPDLFKNILIRNLIGGTSMVVVRKDALLETGGFDVLLPALQDWDLWIRFAKHQKKFGFINEVLVRYFHDNNQHSITRNHDKLLAAYSIIEEKNAELMIAFSKEQQKEYKVNKLNNLIFRDLLNYQVGKALSRQIKKLFLKPKLAELGLVFIIPFGPKWVFKMRSLL